MPNGVTLRRLKTSGERYGCDHCNARWKHPTSILQLYIYSVWKEDARVSINFCLPCAGSLSSALANLAKLEEAK